MFIARVTVTWYLLQRKDATTPIWTTISPVIRVAKHKIWICQGISGDDIWEQVKIPRRTKIFLLYAPNPSRDAGILFISAFSAVVYTNSSGNCLSVARRDIGSRNIEQVTGSGSGSLFCKRALVDGKTLSGISASTGRLKIRTREEQQIRRMGKITKKESKQNWETGSMGRSIFVSWFLLFGYGTI